VSDVPVNLSAQGLPETVLPPLPDVVARALDAAAAVEDAAERRAAIADIAASAPRTLEAWAYLGELARDPIEAYAYFRVGYHRGLDQLRAAGWRGSGYVRWRAPSNRGFLRSLHGLQRTAAAIGETDEAERCAEFLVQLDPSGPWADG
jgi:hypothetical protein